MLGLTVRSPADRWRAFLYYYICVLVLYVCLLTTICGGIHSYYYMRVLKQATIGAALQRCRAFLTICVLILHIPFLMYA